MKPRGLTRLHGMLALGALFGMLQTSCDKAERDAIASETERVGVSREPERCELGSLVSVSRCGAEAACHVCARLDTDEGVCVQPCTIGATAGAEGACPGGQTCRPIGELRDAGGYARVGDCPVGYCR